MTHDTSTGGTLEDQFQDWFDQNVGDAEFSKKNVHCTDGVCVYLTENENGPQKIVVPEIFNPLF